MESNAIYLLSFRFRRESFIQINIEPLWCVFFFIFLLLRLRQLQNFWNKKITLVALNFFVKSQSPREHFFNASWLKTFLSPMLWVVTMSKCHICPLCSQQSHDMWHRQTVLDVSTFSRKSHSQAFQRKYKNVIFFINYLNPLRQSRVEASPLLSQCYSVSHVNGTVVGALWLL